jgi:drug/metabolite transporter (DMT)-like permease
MQRNATMGYVMWISPSRFSLILVALAAALLGTEGLLRRPLLDEMPVAAIVLAEHLLLALFAVPVAVAQRRVLARLPLRTWGILLVIGIGASGGAALLFTEALAAGNPTTTSLLQNTQPLFVVFLAVVLLKERLAGIYWPCLAVALVGAYLLSFGTTGSVATLSRDDLVAAGLALGAAALWASGTVLGRLVLSEMSYVTLTAMRILCALPFLWAVALRDGAVGEAFNGLSTSPAQLGAAALVPGLVAVLLFYRGLRDTQASYAVLAEFMYPAAALAGNWMLLGTLITPLQGLGCLLLIGTILVLSWCPARVPLPRGTRRADDGALAFGD